MVCGYGDEIGMLEPGKLAHLIVVARDPLADTEALCRVVAIAKDGEMAYIPRQARPDRSIG
jgi:imidazolonepropionase-like amidohydrolase